MILEAWLNSEKDQNKIEEIKSKLPKKVKKRRQTEEGWEEFYDYIFPDD